MTHHLRRHNLSGWVCLLSFALHLADTLCPAAYGLKVNPPNAAVGVTSYTWGLGGLGSKALGCATSKVTKAAVGAAADAASGAATQVVDNAIEGRPLSEGVAEKKEKKRCQAYSA